MQVTLSHNADKIAQNVREQKQRTELTSQLFYGLMRHID